MRTATWDEVRARRLTRSSLACRASAERLVQVASDLGGVQAQVQASAELQLAARVDGITQRDVREELWERRSLVKAWTLRGTLHLHPAPELPLWHAARRAVDRAATDEPEGLAEWRDPEGELHPALGHDEGVLLNATGPTTLRLAPALTITLAEAEEGVEKLGRALARLDAPEVTRPAAG